MKSQNEVRRLGGHPDTHGSVSGTLHREWLNVKSAITGKDEAAVLAECERGEDIAARRYQDALAQDLPGDVRSVIERQYQGVLAGVLANHEVVRTLRARAQASKLLAVAARSNDASQVSSAGHRRHDVLSIGSDGL